MVEITPMLWNSRVHCRVHKIPTLTSKLNLYFHKFIFSLCSSFKKKTGLCHHVAVCVFMKLGMYIIAPEPTWTAHFINPSRHSVWLYVHLAIVSRQQLGKNVTVAKNTRKNLWNSERAVFYIVLVTSRDSLSLYLYLLNFSTCTTEAVVCGLHEPSESKIWLWAPWDSEPKITADEAQQHLLDATGLCIPTLLLGNGSVNMFLRQQRIVGAVFSKRSVSYRKQPISSLQIILLIYNFHCLVFTYIVSSVIDLFLWFNVITYKHLDLVTFLWNFIITSAFVVY
jgi:hypothetical protein